MAHSTIIRDYVGQGLAAARPAAPPAATNTLSFYYATNTTTLYFYDWNAAAWVTVASGGGGSGDVVGPASATDNGFAVFDGTTGKLLKDHAATISLTSEVSGILPGANGGTSNGFFAVSGPASTLKTFTFPNASATVLTSNAAVTVAQGGTGVATLTNHGILLGQGTSAIAATAVMTDGQLLVGQSTADPLPKTISGDVTVAASGAVTIANDAVTYAKMQNSGAADILLGRGNGGGAGNLEEITLGTGLSMSGTTLNSTGGGSGDVVGPASAVDTSVVLFDTTTGKLIKSSFLTFTGPASSLKTFTLPNASATILTTNAAVTVAQGGTGATTLTNHGVLLGQGTSAVVATAAMTDGQLLVGQTSADPLPKTISGDVSVAASGAVAIGANKVTDAMLRAGAGLSVIGRSGATPGNVTDIAGASGFLGVNSTPALAFRAVDLTADVTGILPGANGGTANGFFAVSGPTTSLKTFTFPNASATVLTSNAAVTVAQGGTSLATLTAHALYVGNGTSAPTAVTVGTDGQLLVGQTTADPIFKTISGAITMSATGVATGKKATRQVFLTGTAATYTTPSGCQRIVVRAVGGGGGGSGTGTASVGDGTTGTATLFNSIGAAGGGGAVGSVPGIPGTGGAGTASTRLAGFRGQWKAQVINGTATCVTLGGMGAGPGSGQGGAGADGTAAAANTGGGGGGGGIGTQTFTAVAAFSGGAGGGSGEMIEYAVDGPAATYTYTVGPGGAGGSAGTSGQNGAAGGSGYIIVDEYY